MGKGSNYLSIHILKDKWERVLSASIFKSTSNLFAFYSFELAKMYFSGYAKLKSFE